MWLWRRVCDRCGDVFRGNLGCGCGGECRTCVGEECGVCIQGECLMCDMGECVAMSCVEEDWSLWWDSVTCGDEYTIRLPTFPSFFPSFLSSPAETNSRIP